MTEANGQEVRPRDVVRQIYTNALAKPTTDLVVQRIDRRKGLVVGESFDSPPKKDLRGRVRYVPPGWVMKISPTTNN
jgi:hypothetical protein